MSLLQTNFRHHTSLTIQLDLYIFIGDTASETDYGLFLLYKSRKFDRI